jgi:hypothetical protein
LHHIMRVRWFLDYLAAFETLIINRNLNDFKAIFRARRAFRRLLPQYKKVREEIQREITEQNITECSNYSILWQYYVKGVKKYSDLPSGKNDEDAI